MGFWSKLGHGLLKVAPIAATFIPGVGPIAASLIGAGIGAADAGLVEHKGLGGILGGAGLGALEGYGGDALFGGGGLPAQGSSGLYDFGTTAPSASDYGGLLMPNTLGALNSADMGIGGLVSGASIGGASGGGLLGGLGSLGSYLKKHPGVAMGGIAAGGDLLGSYLQARAAKQAADAQVEWANKALQFEQEKYGDAKQNFAPYIANGGNAVNAMGAALMPTDGSPAPTAANLAPQWTGPLLSQAGRNGSSMVTMQAPTGETKQVPDFMMASYLARGAKVVG